MKRRLTFRPEARSDLEDIADYPRRIWSEVQARRYVAALIADIKALLSSALRFPLYDHVHPGLRRKRSGMHHIYYIAAEDRVEVLKVIHVQRDPGLHLRFETWRDEG